MRQGFPRLHCICRVCSGGKQSAETVMTTVAAEEHLIREAPAVFKHLLFGLPAAAPHFVCSRIQNSHVPAGHAPCNRTTIPVHVYTLEGLRLTVDHRTALKRGSVTRVRNPFKIRPLKTSVNIEPDSRELTLDNSNFLTVIELPCISRFENIRR
jgi:hypothetical protein